MSFAERRVTDMKTISGDGENELYRRTEGTGRGSREEPVKKTVKSRRRGAARSVRKRRSFPFAAVFMALVIGVLSGLGGVIMYGGEERPYTVDLKAVEVPGWSETGVYTEEYLFPARCKPQTDQ